MWDNVFKNGPSKICGKQPLKILKGYRLWPMCQLSHAQKRRRKTFYYNLENLKSCNPLNKSSLWFASLTEFARRLSDFHCFFDWFRDV